MLLEFSFVVVVVNCYIWKDCIFERKVIKDGKILYYVYCLMYILNDVIDDVVKIVLKIYLFKLYIISV